MILKPIFKPLFKTLFPTSPTIKHVRLMRPIIKMGKEKFQITIDVRQYNKDDIRVKARPEYVIIEGKQEKQTKKGLVVRQFMRKFRLPDGCHPKLMKTKLSTDALLTITAVRRWSDKDVPTETIIPITLTEKQKDESIISVQNPGVADIKSKCEEKKP